MVWIPTSATDKSQKKNHNSRGKTNQTQQIQTHHITTTKNQYITEKYKRKEE